MIKAIHNNDRVVTGHIRDSSFAYSKLNKDTKKGRNWQVNANYVHNSGGIAPALVSLYRQAAILFSIASSVVIVLALSKTPSAIS